MVEQTRHSRRAVSPQAGPGDVDTGALLDGNVRIHDRSAQATGRQLAVIGDQLVREWCSRRTNWTPAQPLMRTVYRNVHRQLWNVQGLSAAMKAWISSTAGGQEILRSEAWAAWVSSFSTDWTRGAVLTAALAAAADIFNGS